MIDHQIDEEMILREEVSDEALETTALVALGALPTLPNTYCYACPSGVPRHRHQPISANSSSPNATHSAVPMLELLRINLIAVKTNLSTVEEFADFV